MRPTIPRTLSAMLATAVAALLMTACSSTDTTSSSPSPAAPSGPDALTKMICEAQVRKGIAVALGFDTPTEPAAAWTPPTFTCVYSYPDGKFTMTVQEFPDKDATIQFFTAKRDAAPQRNALPGFGEEAFTLPDGSVYLRKDQKVMLIDMSGLPERFGQPAVVRGNAARVIVAAIMHCWIQNAPSPPPPSPVE